MFKKTVPEIWKKKKKAIITVGIFILAAVGGGIFYLRSASAGEVSEGTTTIESATAQTGSIATTVVGSGNIATATAENITIPSDITVNEVLVESGDTVAEGDVLATLDANSILAKMASVQSEIEEIDAELNDLDSDTTETIDTYIAGRVKRIYASQGSNVTDVMRENGALLILSIDGKMAVDIETTTAFSVGDDVDVVLSDGSTIDGTVSKSSSSQITVTMTDSGPLLDETVTVNDTSGNSIGTGVLYVNQPVSITGASGTIDSVDVSEGESVSAEETLLTLTDVSVSSEYLELMATRKSLVETLTDLSTLAQDNTIKATPKEESMKVGMSASATITIEQAENIVTLPASAIQEMGNRVFVYTEMDSETNELSGEVEVETGLSDGNNVEITSGLSEGDSVYYLVITASSDSSTSSEATMIDMGGGMGGGQ